MIDRQFLHRFVQFFLELASKGLAVCPRLIRKGRNEFARYRLFGVDPLEAEERAHAVLSKVAQRGIDRDPVKPGEERRLPLEPLDRLKGLDKRILRQIGG